MSTADQNALKKTLAAALEVGFERGDMQMVQQALDRGADAQHVLRHGYRVHNEELMKMALKSGADINGAARADTAETFLIHAVRNTSYSLAKFCLDNRADPNIRIEGKCALDHALDRLSKDSHEGTSSSAMLVNLAETLMKALPSLKDEKEPAAPAAAQQGATVQAPVIAFDKARKGPTV